MSGWQRVGGKTQRNRRHRNGADRICCRCELVIARGAEYVSWCCLGEETAMTWWAHMLCDEGHVGTDEEGYFSRDYDWCERRRAGYATPDVPEWEEGSDWDLNMVGPFWDQFAGVLTFMVAHALTGVQP